MEAVGFQSVELASEFDYEIQTALRLETEFQGDMERLRKWNRFILEYACAEGPDFIQQHQVKVFPDRLSVTVRRGLISGLK